MLRLVRWFLMLVVAFYVLKFMGMTPVDLWNSAKNKVTGFKDDTQNLVSGKAVQQVSDRMRSEMKQVQQAGPIVADKEMNQDLQAERARLMEAKFDALQKAKIIPVEQGKLSEQVVKNAQAAGGVQ